jgi:SET domain-containing protein
VRRSGIHGRGAFAVRRLRAGSIIIEYRGERIDSAEVDARYGDAAGTHTMLFSIDDNLTIDATRRGSIGRYINHSCMGNCRSVLIDGRVFIEAARNIQPGCELTYDYRLELPGRITKAVREAFACHCGALRCRGTMLYESPARKPRSPRRIVP